MHNHFFVILFSESLTGAVSSRAQTSALFRLIYPKALLIMKLLAPLAASQLPTVRRRSCIRKSFKSAFFANTFPRFYRCFYMA